MNRIGQGARASRSRPISAFRRREQCGEAARQAIISLSAHMVARNDTGAARSMLSRSDSRMKRLPGFHGQAAIAVRGSRRSLVGDFVMQLIAAPTSTHIIA